MSLAAADFAFRLPSDPREFDRTRIPPGRRIELDGRGTTFVREVAGPPGAPTLLLLHGWVASGGLNWFQTFHALSRHFRIIAPDLRGHGRGIRSWERFRLKDNADDVAALIEKLGVGPVIPVGYSMGGTIAQLLWRRHPELVSGLVLCATSHTILGGVRGRFLFNTALSAFAGTTRLGQLSTRLPRSFASRLLPQTSAREHGSLARWAAAEMARHDWRLLLEAGVALGRYDASGWIDQVDVPTAVLITIQDRTLGAVPQLRLALSIPDATIHQIEDGHMACAREEFADPLLDACQEIAERTAPQRRLRVRTAS